MAYQPVLLTGMQSRSSKAHEKFVAIFSRTAGNMAIDKMIPLSRLDVSNGHYPSPGRLLTSLQCMHNSQELLVELLGHGHEKEVKYFRAMMVRDSTSPITRDELCQFIREGWSMLCQVSLPCPT